MMKINWMVQIGVKRKDDRRDTSKKGGAPEAAGGSRLRPTALFWGLIRTLETTYVLDFLCHFLAFPFRFSAQALPLFAH
ncbi:hypothetical protein ACN42_g4858 [Penicillium freii]|uniref:Uncharacterized protein n=1 Tax=Penicillium freii TaxID=48697 RepID=A0A101MKI2_PENFR|nr:hypothetical protein ACN42_g4858 [Penicillium freii]